MNEKYIKALELIEKYDSIIIHRHSNPDGDAIGSQCGLREIIKNNYPEKRVFIVGDSPSRYSFISSSTPQLIEDDVYNESLAIVLDTSSAKLISDDRYSKAKETLRFDHHLFIETICSFEVVDSSFESCCGLISDFALSSKLNINKEAAEALYTGLLTDSGRFLYDSVSPRTFIIASALLERGVDTSSIFSSLYSEEFRDLKRKGRFIDRIELTEHNVSYVYTTKKDLEKEEIMPNAYSRSLVNTMANIKGVSIWVSFTEIEGAVLCEIRSNKANINPIAVKYGGGGHKKASGATLKNREEAFSLLKDLDSLSESIND